MKPEPPADLWERLAELEPEFTTQGRPKGVFTTSEYAEKRGLSHQHAAHILRTMVRDGKLKRVKFRTGQWAEWGYYIP